MMRGSLCLGTMLLLGVHAPAVASGETPTDVVRGALLQAGEISGQDVEKAAKLDQLRLLARDLFDTRAMGRRAIGPVLDEQTATAQSEFLDLFDEVIVRAYLQKLLFFRDPTFRFGGEEKRGDYTVVRTQIETQKDSFSVDYLMVMQPEGWRASEVKVEGISLGANYGEQFRNLLRDNDFEHLLEKMRRKVDHFRSKSES